MVESSAQAKKWVITAITIGVLATLIDEISKNKAPELRVVIGGVFAAVLLTLVAEVEPEVASGFAAIIAVGAILSKGSIFTKFVDWIG